MSLTDVASKHTALKQRANELKAIDKKVDDLLRVHAPDELPPSRSCLPRFLACPGLFTRRRQAVATTEIASVRQSGDNRLVNRMLGKQKQSQGAKLDEAMATVSSRVQSLQERVAIGRERALRFKQQDKREEAVR